VDKHEHKCRLYQKFDDETKEKEALNLFQKLMSHALTLKREYATIKGINYSY